jgi:hypothetical protein
MDINFKIEFTAEVVEVGDDPADLIAEPRPRVVLARGKTFATTVIALDMDQARTVGRRMYRKVKITIEPAEDT